MRPRPVTDPALLAELEGNSNTSNMGNRMANPITDKNLLAELNAGDEGINNFNPSFMEKLAPNVLAGFASMGHSILNAPYNVGKFIESKTKNNRGLAAQLGLTAENIPHLPDYDYSAMLKLPETTSDKFVQGAAESLPAMLMPGAQLGEASALISKIPMIGKYLSGATSRLAPQIAYGAATSPDVGKGAENAAIGQAVGEVLPFGLKSVAKTAEFVVPKGFASKLGDMLSQDYARARAKASQYYKQVTDKIGDKNIYPEGSANKILLPGQSNVSQTAQQLNYRGLDQDVIDKYFPVKVKKLHEDFIDDPTLNNAHRLQKQLGSEAARFGRMKNDPMAGTISESMTYARDILDKDIKSFIGTSRPDLLETWQKGIDTFRTEAAPYRTTGPLLDLATGKRKTITPAQAQNLLTRSVEKGEIPQEHYISQALDALNRKIGRGAVLPSLIPPIAKKFSPFPGILDFASNPYVKGKAQQLSPYYEKLKNAIIASQLNGTDLNNS